MWGGFFNASDNYNAALSTVSATENVGVFIVWGRMPVCHTHVLMMFL